MSTKATSGYRRGPPEGWDAVLRDVTIEISKARQRISELEQSAAIIKKKIASGESFPDQYMAINKESELAH